MKTIIEIAREYTVGGLEFDAEGLECFVERIRADEREECAKVCDEFQARNVGMQPAECAGAIRARGYK